MFTGIVEKKARILRVDTLTDQSRQFEIATGFSDLTQGESVAVNGVCLTVVEFNKTGNALFYVSPETLNKTNLGALETSQSVNLERAMLATTRLSGHIVQGHVDGVGQVIRIQKEKESMLLKVRLPRTLTKYTIEKGSITLSGVSLTINRIEDDVLSFMIIPHTWDVTNLSDIKENSLVNIEVDVLAKYVERLIIDNPIKPMPKTSQESL